MIPLILDAKSDLVDMAPRLVAWIGAVDAIILSKPDALTLKENASRAQIASARCKNLPRPLPVNIVIARLPAITIDRH